MKETIEGWGVLVALNNGRQMFAVNELYTPEVLYTRTGATKLKGDLERVIDKDKLKVVRVRATYEVIEKGGK